MNSPTFEITPENVDALERAYNQAQDTNQGVFVFNNQTLLVKYAKHLLDYCYDVLHQQMVDAIKTEETARFKLTEAEVLNLIGISRIEENQEKRFKFYDRTITLLCLSRNIEYTEEHMVDLEDSFLVVYRILP